MTKENHHILIFDSGVGGLSLLSHLRQRMPDATYSYVADTEMFPYGLLDEQTLINRVLSVVSRAVDQISPDLIIIGCNSASTVCLPSLREKIDLPIVGVVPAIKPAAQLSASKVIGLLATEGTVNRVYTDQLIDDFAQDCSIVRIGSASLVELAEAHIAHQIVEADHIKSALPDLFDEYLTRDMDTVVLACTHFPLLLPQLKLAANHITHWVDSGEAIARRTQNLLSEKQPALSGPSKTLMTKLDSMDVKLASSLSEFGLQPPSPLAI